MLAVTMELFPHGRVKHRQILGTLYITNDGTGTRESGNYHIQLTENKYDGEVLETEVEGFPRLDKDAWDLLYLAIEALRKEEHTD